jgi:hypothetical protein
VASSICLAWPYHEVTSWKLDDAADPGDAPAALFPGGGGGARSHAILVVDCSGSMRKDDVPGHATRTAAVYECLAREFAEPQIKLGTNGGGAVAGEAVVGRCRLTPS